ncbi:MAG: hypothetical protein JWO07_735 [Candidatus Saccharibacteria bacterium]|nr:hypothetical protein [Candidatus Saccharibacteria bacterium]
MSTHHEQEHPSAEHDSRHEVIWSVLERHEKQYADLYTDPTLRRLIIESARDRNIDLPDDSFQTQQSFLIAARMTLDVRNGGSARRDIRQAQLGPDALSDLATMREQQEMDKDTEPKRTHYDIAIVPANYGENTEARYEKLESHMHNADHPVSIDTIVVPASYRKAHTTPDQYGYTEPERAGEIAYSLVKDQDGNLVQGSPAKTEFDFAVNVIEHHDRIPEGEMTRMFSTDRRVPEPHHFQARGEIAYNVGDDGVLRMALSSPMVSDKRYYERPGQVDVRRARPNTNDNMIMVMDMLWDVIDENTKKPTVLLVTESIYRFQQVIAESMLARKGIRVESIYVSPKTADLPEYSDSAYGQEILSLLIQLDQSITELQQELNISTRAQGHTALEAASR